MNQVQRNFLIEKIKSEYGKKVKELKEQEPEYPSVTNYLFHAVMKNEFELRTTEHLKEVIRQKALNAKEDGNWLNSERMGFEKNTMIKILITDLFVLPEEFKKKYDEYRKAKEKIQQQIDMLKIQTESLITRIQLSSDKTLQRMINEVDDMGEISLIETKLKLISNEEIKKLK